MDGSCLTVPSDALFELADAVLYGDGLVRSLVPGAVVGAEAGAGPSLPPGNAAGELDWSRACLDGSHFATRIAAPAHREPFRAR